MRQYTIEICEQCLKLEGQMCHNPGCTFIRCDMKEVENYLDILKIRPLVNGVPLYLDEGDECIF